MFPVGVAFITVQSILLQLASTTWLLISGRRYARTHTIPKLAAAIAQLRAAELEFQVFQKWSEKDATPWLNTVDEFEWNKLSVHTVDSYKLQWEYKIAREFEMKYEW